MALLLVKAVPQDSRVGAESRKSECYSMVFGCACAPRWSPPEP